jgi:hypothetical protein
MKAERGTIVSLNVGTGAHHGIENIVTLLSPVRTAFASTIFFPLASGTGNDGHELHAAVNACPA